MSQSLKYLLMLVLIGMSRAGAQQRSPIADLLTRARTALDNLQNARADSIGRSVLALGSQASREEHLEALEIVAAALYPEDASGRNRDAASDALREYVLLVPDREIPRTMSWPGLDSLLLSVRASTFSAAAHPTRENTLTGATATVDLPVLATRPARFALYAVPKGGGGAQLLDTSVVTRSTHLHFGILNGDQVRLPSGAYILELRARDPIGRDSLVRRYLATVTAPPLDLLPVPTAITSGQLLPESEPAHRARNAAVGVALGGATMLLAALFRAPDPVRSGVGGDARAYGVALGVTLGGVLGGLSDRGTTLPDNIRHNVTVHEQFAAQVQAAQSENTRRRSAYRAAVIIEGDPQ
ncbi:MAG TPA: hypothetical protein VJN62_01380 [Gemmatimonadales bacterium]|nr:hypothetical protein [Gemmatimonadales bacterium]